MENTKQQIPIERPKPSCLFGLGQLFVIAWLIYISLCVVCGFTRIVTWFAFGKW
jgi:hypothetical protein